MDCLKDYIGLKGCCEDKEPASGLYINSLAGITSEMIESLAEREQQTGKVAYSNVQVMAARKFYTDIISKLRKNYRLKQLHEEFIYKPEISVEEEDVAADEFRGILLQFAWTHSTFLSFTVSKVYVVSPYAGNVTHVADIVFLNEDGVELLRMKDIAFNSGINVIDVDKIFAVRTLFIGVDATSFKTIKSDLEGTAISCFCESIRCLCGDCDASIGGYIYTDGFTKTAHNTHGVGVWGYAGCDYYSLICNNKELFTSAWLNLLGIQSVISLLYSTRINRFTTVNKEQYMELRDFYQVEYEKQLETALEGIVINARMDCCVECEQPVNRVQWLP